jgi:hypothetical protein
MGSFAQPFIRHSDHNRNGARAATRGSNDLYTVT